MPVTIDFDPAAYASAAEAHPSAGDLGLQGLDTFLEPVRARYKVPALAVAVARSGGVFAAGAVGVRVAGMEDRVTIVDQFHLGSCTKSVTATVAAALVEDGKIQWETTIADVFPALVAQMRPEYRDVTLAQLLSHRSGLPAQDCALLAHGWALEGDTKTQRGEFARLALQLEPAATPGTAFLYTDIGYIVAGVMLEVVADRSWEDLVREDVGRRLGLESLGFGEPAQPGKMDQPWGHVTDGARVLPFPPGPYAMMDNPMVIAPAGLLHLSILDWGKYATEHLKGARGEDTVLLRSGDYEALQADTYHQQYGYGWGVSKGERGALLTHTGSCGEWYSMIWIAPDLDLAIVAATNISGGNGMAACRDALQVAQTEFIHD